MVINKNLPSLDPTGNDMIQVTLNIYSCLPWHIVLTPSKVGAR